MSGMIKGMGTFLSNYWGVIAILVLWEAWVNISGLNAIVLPSPASVFFDLASAPGLYATNAAQTFVVALLGLLLGLAGGILLALVAWASRLLNGLLTPLGLIFSCVPVVALIPIIARLLGYDMRTEIAIVAIAAFFPTFVFVGAGLRALPPGSDDLFKVFGASRTQRFLRLVLPAAVPNLMIALRLTAPEAILAAILAELLMGTSGLGFMFREASGRFAMERAFGTSIIATITAVICFGLVMAAERRVATRWQ